MMVGYEFGLFYSWPVKVKSQCRYLQHMVRSFLVMVWLSLGLVFVCFHWQY